MLKRTRPVIWQVCPTNISDVCAPMLMNQVESMRKGAMKGGKRGIELQDSGTWLGLKGAEHGSWTAVASRGLRGGFAEASRRLRGGFAGASQRLRENLPSFLAKPGLKRTVLFRSSSRNLPVILS